MTRKTRKVKRLRKLRRDREWTLAYVGAKVGLKPPQLCRIEQGQRDPSLQKAIALSHLFGRSIEELLEDVEIPA